MMIINFTDPAVMVMQGSAYERLSIVERGNRIVVHLMESFREAN